MLPQHWPAPTFADETLPQLAADALPRPDLAALQAPGDPGHAPRILVLYGSLRERSYSRLLSEEAIRILAYLGAEPITFDPRELPLTDAVENGSEHPKVRELFAKAMWSEGMVWISPERHGAMTGVMKNQIDWLPLALAGMRPTQGRTLALGQVCGGSQSFNTLNQMRVLGRWMRMVTIPNQSSVPKAFNEFDEAGRMHASPYFNRLVDVLEELVKFTWMVRGRGAYLVDRYSERVESAAQLSARVNQKDM